MIKDKIKNLDLSATLKINEISTNLEKKGKEIECFLNESEKYIRFNKKNREIYFIQHSLYLFKAVFLASSKILDPDDFLIAFCRGSFNFICHTFEFSPRIKVGI